MSIFTPFQLAHSTLPTLTPAASQVVEVTISTERAFPDNEDVYGTPLNLDHALSAAFEPYTGTLLRVIHNGYSLELRSVSPVLNPDHPIPRTQALRIFLPEPLRPLAPGSIVALPRAGMLVVLALSTTNVIYRFTFPLNNFVDKGDRVDFETKGNDWIEEWEIDDHVTSVGGGISTWAVTGDNCVVLGCVDGSIIKVERANDSSPDQPMWIPSLHRGQSRLRGLFGRGSEDRITSISDFNGKGELPVVYTFSSNWKLRTWSFATGQMLKSVDVRPESSTAVVANGSPSTSQQVNGESEQLPLVRVISHPDPFSRYSHIVVVFVPTPYDPSSPGTFVFYRASHGANSANDLLYAGERPASAASAGSELRGFEVQPPTRSDRADGWRLWAVWDSKGTLAADSVPVDDILQFSHYFEPASRSALVHGWTRAGVNNEVDTFDAAYFDNLLSTEPPNPADPANNFDIAKLFTEHLFHPGRFSSLTLMTALDDYIAQLPAQHQRDVRTAVFPSLLDKFDRVVGCSHRMEISPQTGAPVVDVYRRNLKLDWLGIWARVREINKQARWPVSTASLNGQLLILDREGASVPVQEDACGVLTSLAASELDPVAFQTVPEGPIRAQYPALAPPQSRRGLTGLALAGATIASALSRSDGSQSGSALSRFLKGVDGDLCENIGLPVEEIIDELWEVWVSAAMTPSDHESVQRALSESYSVPRTISEALDILTHLPTSTNTDIIENWELSGFGNTLVTSTLSSIIDARYIFARNTLLVTIFYLCAANMEAGEAEQHIQLMSRALVIYHRYSVLHWLREQTGEEALSGRGDYRAKRVRNDVVADFGSLRMKDVDDEDTADGYDGAYSLLFSLLSHAHCQPVPKSTNADLFRIAVGILAQIDLVSSDPIQIEAGPADVKLAYSIYNDGHPYLALDLIERYSACAGMVYVRGRANLDIALLAEGVSDLELAAAGYRDASLQAILPLSDSHGLSDYYRRIMGIVAEHGLDEPVAKFGKLALETAAADDESTRDIWNRVFVAYNAMGQYEDAYAIFTAAPFMDIKRDLLGQLISTMCEANAVGRLTQLGFIGFQQDVEERLNFKARNSDPLRTPNYYNVLYTWHISHGDYRSAAEIMFAQGHRLYQVTAGRRFELASRAAQAFLTAINALSLVDERNQWISTYVPTDWNRKHEAKARVTTYIPEKEFTPDTRTVNIVTLADIKHQYTVLLSLLSLTNHIPELHQGPVWLSDVEIVGLLVGRSLYDLAFKAASVMEVDMSDAFQSLATRCVELDRVPSLLVDNPAAAFLASSPVTARLRGPPAALALRYLQTMLSRHDGPSTQYRYVTAVSDVFFTLNASHAAWVMPPFLVAQEMHRDAEGWISRALEHGWVAEAVAWSRDMLRAATPPELLPKRSEAADGGYNVIDRVLAAAEEKDESEEVRAAAKALREETVARIEALKRLQVA